MAAGLSVCRDVEVLVTAGADPGRVVYVAITDFCASEVVPGTANAVNFICAPEVVRCAANAVERIGLSDAALLTQMATIVSAARQAGASETAVNTGLSNAGVPPAVIASANTRAASSTPPVYGYTAPPGSTPPPTAGIGGAFGRGGGGGLIGGASIGKPPTTPASPTKPTTHP